MCMGKEGVEEHTKKSKEKKTDKTKFLHVFTF